MSAPYTFLQLTPLPGWEDVVSDVVSVSTSSAIFGSLPPAAEKVTARTTTDASTQTEPEEPTINAELFAMGLALLEAAKEPPAKRRRME